MLPFVKLRKVCDWKRLPSESQEISDFSQFTAVNFNIRAKGDGFRTSWIEIGNDLWRRPDVSEPLYFTAVKCFCLARPAPHHR